MDKKEKKILRKFEKKIGEIKIKRVRLYDPRVKRFRRPGNNDPALILYDILKRSGYPVMEPSLENLIKKMANFCDKKMIKLNGVIENPKAWIGRKK